MFKIQLWNCFGISKNKLLWGLNEPSVWIYGTSNSSVCLLLKPKPIANRAVLEKVLFSFRSTINYFKLWSEIKWLVPLHFLNISSQFGWNLCCIHYDVLQCIFNCFYYCMLVPVGIGFVSYLRTQIELLSTFVYENKMGTGGRSAMNLYLAQGGTNDSDAHAC